ncbi:unnamed protein product [Lactuca virosa]|uniref:Isopropylmalate dehydrogenase-like domain-containing protein n=1 Tax=Lactuca virosa TaxID=75947 RepID=A0AAU9NGY5_9ASTR|nr:unnamed protein product [Lactuca virosa]
MAQRTVPILKKLFSDTPPHLRSCLRSITYMPRPGRGGSIPVNPITGEGIPRLVTLIPGDGIGPLVTGAVEQVFEAMRAPVTFEKFEVHGDMNTIPDDVMASIKKNRVCLKGGLITPVGGGVNSLNLLLRKELDLENTEGEYSGLEHEVVPGVVESLKVITKFCSERIAQYAFEYAHLNNRKTVTAVHKANIMKLADGLFLESCREIAKRYPNIKYNEIIVDNCCMQLVSKPEQFDVMVTPNLYGNLVANTAAGIAGGTGVMPGGNVGTEYAIFEQGASAGNVGKPKIVEKKRANPVALFLSSAMMLRHLQLPDYADRLENAVKRVIFEGKYRTKDLGGSSTTQEVADAVISALE